MRNQRGDATFAENTHVVVPQGGAGVTGVGFRIPTGVGLTSLNTAVDFFASGPSFSLQPRHELPMRKIVRKGKLN
jgi:hypothetical protein